MTESHPGIEYGRLITPEEIKYTGPAPRLIAMADVLGFGDLTKRLDASKLAELYKKLLGDVESAIGVASFDAIFNPLHHMFCDPLLEIPKIHHCVFSDTILLWSRPFPPDTRPIVQQFNVLMFLNCVRLISFVGLNRGLPLRIGIAIGECVMAPEEQVYLGKALMAAYETERRQEWMGVAYHPSLLEAFGRWPADDLDSLRWAGLLVRYRIPVKDPGNPPKLEWSMDWPLLAEHEVPGVNVDVTIEQVCQAFIKQSRSDVVRTKWQNTLSYIQACRDRRKAT